MSRLPVLPTRMSADDLSGLTTKDFFPDRQDKTDNTEERMLRINSEVSRLCQLRKGDIPKQEDFSTLYHELPTLWDMIEKGKFRFWSPKDQNMLKQMISLKMKVVKYGEDDEEAEKEAGKHLAERFLYPKIGGSSRNNTG